MVWRNPIRIAYDWVLAWAERPGGPWALAAISFAESSFFPGLHHFGWFRPSKLPALCGGFDHRSWGPILPRSSPVEIIR